ncbi:MAG: bifunctional glycosyltransferase family 2 protein/CDP-glycerol:glycerophosphate glycerophosphotransferase [Clostridiales bacterium]|nr:bifunctional glycosyltransferase family 2 protein/CDP-glycerol:glycerophosphate glycerophosphotransferase [Clostridiales bacterium]
MMRVTVIIPFHKGEAYLRDCLDSVVAQTYDDIEVIVINDHSPDEDLACISEYENRLNLKLYHLDDKTGVAAARNLGLDRATGDYIYFLDSDDYIYEDAIELLVSGAQERDDDITYGKKKPTWFQRSVYLLKEQEKQEEQEAQDQEEENDENDLQSPDLKMEDDQEEGSQDSYEEFDDASDDKDSSDESKDTKEDRKDRKSNLADDDGYVTDDELTEEELLLRRAARTRMAYRILVSKRKGIRNISVLNILFKRNLIEENGIRFTENLVYFSDIPFLMEALSKTNRYKKRFGAKYVKRKHNDAINFPALSQIRDPNRFNEYVEVYYETIKRIEKPSDLKRRFDKKYVNYYSRVYAPRLKRSANNIWREDNFLIMSKLFKELDREVIRKLRGYRKRLIKALIDQDVNKSIRIVKLRLGRKKLKRIMHNKKAFYKSLYIHIFLKRPVKRNWILFESFFGKSYSDSPKYIYEFISANLPGKYKCIWVINEKGKKIPFRHKKIKRFSLRYYYYLARCGYIVFNSRQPVWAVKRKENVFLQTWHGTPLKKLVFDIDDISSATPKYKQQVYKQSRAWDYLIAANGFSSETFKRCFLFNKTILNTGYPRNDILHSPDRDQIASIIRNRLSIPRDKKTILYAPTWRDDEFYDKGQYKFKLHLDLDLMRKELEDEYVILIRTHYFIADSLDLSSLSGFAYNVSKYDDISELYLISDILITDYSSVFFDFANLKRPMLFFTYDLEKYRDVLRGFYIDIEKEVPGPLVFTSEEVIEAIKEIDVIQEKYKDRYEEFYNRFCGWEDGQASKKVVESVFRVGE